MRVTSTATFRNTTASVNDVHNRLNKSMNKISSGKAYETAADNPLAYYEGKKIDSQYLDTLSKLSLTSDVKSRLYQQEAGALDIQNMLSKAKGRVEFVLSETNNADMNIVDTVKNQLLSFEQTMANDLNSQYQDLYVFGGNDVATPPFALSADGSTLTFRHIFAGDTKATEMVMTLTKQNDGSYQYEFSGTDKDGAATDETATLQNIIRAMSEQGRLDIGYGTIFERDTLLDTYTGGLNVITGLSSDAVRSMMKDPNTTEADVMDAIKDRLNNSSIGLVGRAVMGLNDYINGGQKDTFTTNLSSIMDTMTVTEHDIGTVYSDLGNKYAIVETVEERLTKNKVELTSQYKDKMGADPYEAILEMYANKQSYDAALKVSSQLMSSSLFDFMRG